MPFWAAFLKTWPKKTRPYPAAFCSAQNAHVKKEEVKVESEEGRVLQISGERSQEQEEKSDTDTWHQVERSRGRFLRRFTLPENAKVEEVKAAVENGVLTITVPKEEVKKPDVRAI